MKRLICVKFIVVLLNIYHIIESAISLGKTAEVVNDLLC